MFPRLVNKLLLFVLLAALGVPAAFSQDYDKVEINSIKLADNLYMLQGWGGNMAALVGDDGVFLVDAQMAPLTEKIRAAISEFSDKEVRFLINTHWHFDHVGGNENFAKQGATIIAHENQRKEASVDHPGLISTDVIPALPDVALPIITFSDKMTFHINGEEVSVFNIENAHTNGDAIVYFKNANVLHTGDIYFEGMYPFIDVAVQGSARGMARAGRQILTMINRDTKVIPGHGPLCNKAQLTEYIEMLEDLDKKISKFVAKGKSLEEVQALSPTKKYDEKWGKGFLPPKEFTRLVFEGIRKNN